MKLRFCLIIGLLLLTSSFAKADELISIYLNNTDLSPVRIDISTISTIKFKTKKLVVKNNDNSTNDFYFSDIVKITFNEEGASIETHDVATARINPNPAKDIVTIQNAEQMYGSDVCIYSITGMLIDKLPQWNGESIDVSNLSPGIYFINSNSTTLKFVKQ
jgi:hypothetical protein